MDPNETMPRDETGPGNEPGPETPNHGRFRPRILLLYAALVPAFGVGGMLQWGGALKPLREPFGGLFAYIIGLPLGLLTWPAHEYALERMGPGAGANAHSELSMGAAVIFLVWAAFLWGPILAAFRRKAPLWLVFLFQFTVLLTVFGLFWEYGNG